MESAIIFETLLWLLVGIVATGMSVVLVIGWLKGVQWQKEMQLKKRQTQRYTS